MTGKFRYLGTALAIAFIGYVLWRGLDDLPAVDLSSPMALVRIGLAVFAYVISQVIGALAWGVLLRAWSVSLPPGRAESQHLVSQIGKYVPGNVGQFVGRIALARQDGVPMPVIGLAMLFEIGLLIGTAALLVAGAFVFLPNLAKAVLDIQTVKSIGQHFWIFPGVASVVFLGVGWALLREARRRKLQVARPMWLLFPILFYVANFAALGASLSIVCAIVAPDREVSVGVASCIFALAWVAGFVIPGAPGGIGIRDGIVAVGLGLTVGDGSGLVVAVLHRAASVLGDVLVFVLAGTMRWRMRTRA